MIATHFLIQILQTITARAHGNTLNESTNRYTKYKDCQGTHSKIKETENKTWSGGCSTNRSYCKNLKTKASTPGPGVIAQWTGIPRTSSRFWIQSSNPSWKVLVALGHWTWLGGTDGLSGGVCYGASQNTHITTYNSENYPSNSDHQGMGDMKISLNGLDGTDFFHKIQPNWYHQIWARWFFRIFEATVFCSTSGTGFWQAHPSCSWAPSFSYAPSSSAIQRGEHCLEPWSTPRSFVVYLFGGYLMWVNTPIPVLQKRKDLVLII